MPYCPECSASVPEGVAACPTCGASLGATPPDAPDAQPSQASDIELVTADLRHSLAPQYELLRILGTGGMGAVFLMREPALKRLVAVKILAPWLAADARARTRFEREARAAAALAHPNVARVYAEGETLGLRLPYIVMQFVDGPTLAEWMEQHHRASEREARRMIGEVAAALAAAHARQLVHRDVKPTNVLIENETGRAYVVDFGVSAALVTAGGDEATRLTATGTVAGTPIYMSPEQASGETVTPKSDVYSLGIMAYELLVGELPYEARTAMGWAAAHLRDTPTPVRIHRADLAPEVAALVDRCLAKDAADRPAADEVARGLLPSIESEIEWPPPGLHWMRGRGAVLGQLGAATAAGALLTLTALLLTPPILRAHGNWLWRFQVERASSATDPSSVPLFVWQTALALGIAVFALGTLTFLGLGTRVLARCTRLRRDGWRWTTLADLAADRDGRSGSILSGAREFASLEVPRRHGILQSRRLRVAWRIGAGLWVAAGLGVWALVLALSDPSPSRAAPLVGLPLWLLVAVPPLLALAASAWAQHRERRYAGPLRRVQPAGHAETDATRWYRGLPGEVAPAAAPSRHLPVLARAAGVFTVVLGGAAAIAIAEAAVAGVAAVLFTQRLGSKTVAFTADQARLAADDPIRAAQRAVRAYLPADSAVQDAVALGWLRGLLRPADRGGAPAYTPAPTAIVTAPGASLRDAARGLLGDDSLALLEALGAHSRTDFFRRLARFESLDSLLEARPRAAARRGARDSTELDPARTTLEDAAVANLAGAVAAVARHRYDSAAARLGENAAFAEALLRVANPRFNQIGARLLTRSALEPLATLASLRGDAAGAALLTDAAQRMTGAMPYAAGVAGLAVDPKDLIQFTGAVLSPRVPVGYRVEWMSQGWAGLCANPWELLAGPSDARRDAILAAADLAADIPRARDFAIMAGEQWAFRFRTGWSALAGFLADRGPWGLVWRIRECGRVV
jgi:predicted Ser/Thr protein kinase